MAQETTCTGVRAAALVHQGEGLLLVKYEKAQFYELPNDHLEGQPSEGDDPDQWLRVAVTRIQSICRATTGAKNGRALKILQDPCEAGAEAHTWHLVEVVQATNGSQTLRERRAISELARRVSHVWAIARGLRVMAEQTRTLLRDPPGNGHGRISWPALDPRSLRVLEQLGYL